MGDTSKAKTRRASRGATAKARPAAPEVKRINLALQGGGAHGAFTWGVLDRLLEDESIVIEGISGTSAGAVNGAVLAYGLTVGGRATARELLARLWDRIASLAALSPVQPSPIDRLFSVGRMDFSPGYHMMDLLSRAWSPYLTNALDIRPLRHVLDEIVDFEVLRSCRSVKLFVSATNVLRGRVKVFNLADMTADAILASACLPFIHQAVEIDGEAYWDGGYMGNPAIYPLIYHTESRDVLLVQINPINIDEVPRTPSEILDRLNTLTFNSGLMREMRAIAFVTRMIESGLDEDGRLKHLLIHVIQDEEAMQELGISSKLNADRRFLQHLFEIGREQTDDWLSRHREALGRHSTVDIQEMFL